MVVFFLHYTFFNFFNLDFLVSFLFKIYFKIT